MKEHEDVLVFAKSKPIYYPIKEARQGSGAERVKHRFNETKSGEFTSISKAKPDPTELRYPSSVQEFNNRASGDRGFHPTQKPVALLEYLIKTYSNEGDLVLDNCMGSGSTCVAAKNTNRDYIGIELDKNYYDIAVGRVNNTKKELGLFD